MFSALMSRVQFKKTIGPKVQENMLVLMIIVVVRSKKQIVVDDVTRKVPKTTGFRTLLLVSSYQVVVLYVVVHSLLSLTVFYKYIYYNKTHLFRNSLQPLQIICYEHDYAIIVTNNQKGRLRGQRQDGDFVQDVAHLLQNHRKKNAAPQSSLYAMRHQHVPLQKQHQDVKNTPLL